MTTEHDKSPNPRRQPNVLFILSDEHAGPAMGCAGHPVVQTPNLDALAAQGVRFENAYCNNPLCTPSRASLMTGQLVHRTETWENSSTYSSEMATIAHVMRAAGYQAHLIGKMHMIGADQLHGFHTHTCEHKPDVCLHDHERLYQTDWDNFDFHSQPQVGPPASLPPDPKPKRDYCPYLRPGEDQQFMPSDRATHAAALDFLDNYRPDLDAPFFLTVSYNLPHFPYQSEKRFYDLYADGIDAPATDHNAPLPEALTYFTNRRHADRERIRQMRQAYYGLISHLDWFVGDLIAGLEARGLRDDTIIIHSSDHGDMAGERGLFMKSVMYEWSARVPMIFNWPGQLPAGKVVRESVSLVDLLPTLQAIGGVEYDGPCDGRSLWDVARGQATLDAERPVFCDYYGYGTPSPGRMVRQGDWKLIVYHGYDDAELYHLPSDPHELHNRYDDPAARDARDRLLASAYADWDPAALDARIRANQRQRRLIVDTERRYKHLPLTKPPYER